MGFDDEVTPLHIGTLQTLDVVVEKPGHPALSQHRNHEFARHVEPQVEALPCMPAVTTSRGARASVTLPDTLRPCAGVSPAPGTVDLKPTRGQMPLA